MRIELQDKERDLLESYIMANAATSAFKSILSLTPTQMYAWITVAEGLGLIDTPVPTLGDGTIEDAIRSIMAGFKAQKDAVTGEGVGPMGMTMREMLTYYLTGELPARFAPNSPDL